uniref:Uncharacterized protein n=1 Tax=Alexandrium catenella TaxID=2925 RepID=A0A7S1L702_ALECA|mmetsp:Transcript_107659/g.286566  ORF Transcript_107659/g.286566 Transcript_107659/m.286566 type:complete len:317 (+) Transcript_107659:58-1008(+)
MAARKPPPPHHAVKNAHDLSTLRGGLAIITGGAAGIGYALAEAALAHGLHAVLADVDGDGLKAAEAKLREGAANGLEVFGHVTDVSSEASVQALARAVSERFPGQRVSLLCCNAGASGGNILTSPSAVWDRAFGINVFGVAHCIRHFVPGMIRQRVPGSVVLTASQDGVCASQGIYGASKHANVALGEGLFQELQGRLSVHVLCPHVTATDVFTGGVLKDGSASEREKAGSLYIKSGFQKFGSPPSKMADMVFSAIQSGSFYVFGENDREPGFVRLQAETRMKAMLGDGLPRRPNSTIFAQVFSPPKKKDAPPSRL